MIKDREQMTERERAQNAHEKDMLATQAAHVQRVKEIERDAKLAEIKLRAEIAEKSRESTERIRNAELELARIEAKWLSWLRVPLTIVRLPLLLVFGLAYCIAVARDRKPDPEFWHLVRP